MNDQQTTESPEFKRWAAKRKPQVVLDLWRSRAGSRRPPAASRMRFAPTRAILLRGTKPASRRAPHGWRV